MLTQRETRVALVNMSPIFVSLIQITKIEERLSRNQMPVMFVEVYLHS